MSTTHHDLQSTATGAAPLNALTKGDLSSLRASFGPYLEMYNKIKKDPINLLLSPKINKQFDSMLNKIKLMQNPLLQLYAATIIMAATGCVREIMFRRERVYKGCSPQNFTSASAALMTFDEATDKILLPIIAKKIPQEKISDVIEFLITSHSSCAKMSKYIRRVQKALYAYHGIPMPRTYANRLPPGVLPHQARLTA